jgi:organic hydroperoxide reductase OsmC/OhrA
MRAECPYLLNAIPDTGPNKVMHPFPHIYPVTAIANPDSTVSLTSPGTEPIESMGPVEFGGPGDRWSPESLLVAAVADCFILSFRAISRAARLDWSNLECAVRGTLDKADNRTRFTRFDIEARLEIPEGTSAAKAEKLLHKAEHSCLITNSLNGESHVSLSVNTR